MERIIRKPRLTQEMLDKVELKIKYKITNFIEHRMLNNKVRRENNKAKYNYDTKICDKITNFQQRGHLILIDFSEDEGTE